MKKLLLTMMMFSFAILLANALSYTVTVPFGTKDCYIAGEMNGWKYQPMTKVDEAHYTIEIKNANIAQKYKYCSGPGWGYVETTNGGRDIENRSYTTNDVVISWMAVYDKTLRDINLVYNVTVPKGTKSCYISGGWNGWSIFKEMKKIDDTHFRTTVLSNKMLKYNYFSGPGWGYVEMAADKDVLHEKRSYSASDVVSRWDAVYDKASPDAEITYKVFVPNGTNHCYMAGGWDGWSSFLEMKKVDSRHYSLTIKSNKALRYIYLSGPEWKYIESNPGMSQAKARSYYSSDTVDIWTSVFVGMNEKQMTIE